MPVYDYKCDACGVRFERNHSMDAPQIKECPTCGQQDVRKIFSTGGILKSTKGGQSSSPPPPCATGGCASGMCGMS